MEGEFLSFIEIFVYNFKLCPFLPYCYIPDTYVSLFDGILMLKYEHLKIQFKTIISPPLSLPGPVAFAAGSGFFKKYSPIFHIYLLYLFISEDPCESRDLSVKKVRDLSRT